MDGLMMNYPLTLRHFLDRAKRLHHRNEVVSNTPEGLHRYTYGEFHARTLRLANVLRELGVERGDRVATFALNSYRHLELYFAVPCSGAVLHTLNIRLFPEQLEYIVNHAEDKLIFVDAALVPALEQHVERLGSVSGFVVMGPVPADTKLSPVYDYERLLDEASPDFDFPPVDENEAAVMCYTSGTTGEPKGALYSHRALFLHSVGIAMADTLGISESDCCLTVVPQFHANAWGLPFACTMSGSKQVFPGPFMQPERLAEMMESEQVTVAAGVPTIWIGLYHHLKEKKYDLSSLRYMVVGGAAMPRSLIDGFQNELGIPILHAWGMTETSPLGTVSRPKRLMTGWSNDDLLDVAAKQGNPATGIELRICGDDGVELPWDGKSMGELQVRGPWVIREYFKLAVSEQSFTADGWFRTGDIATMDEHGYMNITDRTKDVIKSGGEWISSVELENLIMSHPDVKECAVIAMPDEKWGERPMAVVCPVEVGSVVSKESIHEFLEGRVASYWKPDAVVNVEEIPRTSVGKFNKRALREQME